MQRHARSAYSEVRSVNSKYASQSSLAWWACCALKEIANLWTSNSIHVKSWYRLGWKPKNPRYTGGCADTNFPKKKYGVLKEIGKTSSSFHPNDILSTWEKFGHMGRWKFSIFAKMLCFFFFSIHPNENLSFVPL